MGLEVMLIDPNKSEFYFKEFKRDTLRLFREYEIKNRYELVNVKKVELMNILKQKGIDEGYDYISNIIKELKEIEEKKQIKQEICFNLYSSGIFALSMLLGEQISDKYEKIEQETKEIMEFILNDPYIEPYITGDWCRVSSYTAYSSFIKCIDMICKKQNIKTIDEFENINCPTSNDLTDIFTECEFYRRNCLKIGYEFLGTFEQLINSEYMYYLPTERSKNPKAGSLPLLYDELVVIWKSGLIKKIEEYKEQKEKERDITYRNADLFIWVWKILTSYCIKGLEKRCVLAMG